MTKNGLTKLKALQICRELWVWMRNTEATDFFQKAFWEGWVTYGEMSSHCPCCEYVEQHLLTCSACPLLSHWGEGSAGLDFPCMGEFSPYLPFHEKRGTSADAERIIDACYEEMVKLKKTEGSGQ